MIVLVSRDLFFASKVTGTAAALGLPAATVATVEALVARTDMAEITGVILDLGSGIAPTDVLSCWPATSRPRMLAFGAHVDVTALQAATAAGFEIVLPRSRFSAELPQQLRALASLH